MAQSQRMPYERIRMRWVGRSEGEKEDAIENRRLKLFDMHVAAAVVHLLVATSLIILLATGRDWDIPVYTRYALWTRADPDRDCSSSNPCTVELKQDQLFRVGLGILLLLCPFLSFINHLVVLILLNWWQRFVRAVERGQNLVRWIEYSLSASIMLYVIAALSGLSDLWTALWLTACITATMFFGFATEVTWDLRWYVAGFIVHALAWIPIMAAFVKGVAASGAPGAVQAVAPTLLTLFLGFAVVPLVQFSNLSKNPARARDRHLACEAAYAILSIVSKTTLVGLVYSGVIMRDENDIVNA